MFHYAYRLMSVDFPERRCTGSTQDLRERLTMHNRGEVPSTDPPSVADRSVRGLSGS